MNTPGRILIVDDHPIVREGLKVLIAAQPDLEVGGEAEDLPEALALLDSKRFDVAIIDISLKTGNGIDLVKRITARGMPIPILVWSMYPDSLYAERALRAGARGYLNKGNATLLVIEAVRVILSGKIYLSANTSDRLLSLLVRSSGKQIESDPTKTLSARELETLELLGQGLTTQQIAEKMHVSHKTVETYRVRIKVKLNLNSCAETIRFATTWLLDKT